jgi:hypothetical protein
MVPTKAFRRSTIVRRGFGRHSRIKHTEAFHPFILSMRRLQCQVYVLEWSFRACLKIRPVGDLACKGLEFWAYPVGRVPSRGAGCEFSKTLLITERTMCV